GVDLEDPLSSPPAAPAAPPAEHRVERDSTQAHIVVGSDTFGYRDPRRFALALVVNAFGGGMSSRLFQRIREELGLAYAVYAYQQLFQSAGIVGVYVGTQPGTADQAVEAIRREYERLANEGLPSGELAEAKQQLKGQVMLSLESPSSRMNRLAGTELHQDRYRTLDEVLAEIDAVSAGDVAALTSAFFAPGRQTVVRLGPL
ncbi:MAG: M16 family metallopeptidase, partial [Gemmatimonadales bacterium]